MITNKILVAFDYTDIAEHALDWAAGQVKHCGASVSLLHVVALIPPTVAPEAVIPIEPPQPEDIRAYEERLREAASRHGVGADVHVMVAASVGAAIVGRAQELAMDMVVVGTHARGPLARAFLGSVADYVVRHAHCPVVTIRLPKAK